MEKGKIKTKYIFIVQISSLLWRGVVSSEFYGCTGDFPVISNFSAIPSNRGFLCVHLSLRLICWGVWESMVLFSIG
jgi:hypothetical protein